MPIADQFRGLPIEDLIVSPLIGMAKGQAALNDVAWKYIQEVAFEAPKEGKEGDAREAKQLKIALNRFVADPKGGAPQLQIVHSQIPMLPLVPIPSLAITKADISFTMEVKETVKDHSLTGTKSTVDVKSKNWFSPVDVTVHGEVSTTRENTRETDNSAKYEVNVHAEQLPPTEGMLKLSDMLTTLMDPITQPAAGGKGGSGE